MEDALAEALGLDDTGHVWCKTAVMEEHIQGFAHAADPNGSSVLL